jgi:hypothetical protein
MPMNAQEEWPAESSDTSFWIDKGLGLIIYHPPCAAYIAYLKHLIYIDNLFCSVCPFLSVYR